MASGVITDVTGNVYTGISDSTTLNFTTIPTDPLLSFSDPFNGDTHQVDNDIELFFNETVVAGSGNIIISNGSDTRTIDVTDTSQVTFDDFGRGVTISPAADLILNTTYNIQMASGVITDTEGNAYAGISDPTTLNFTTTPTDPFLTFSEPFNGSTHQVNNDIELFFNETVVAGSGNIIISNGSDTRTIDVTDASQVTFSDFSGVVTINPTTDLVPHTTYNIQMASGVVTDTAGNAYAGISDPTTLNFTTIDIQGVNLINGLGGAAGFGEQVLPRNDDDSTGFIDLSSIFEDGLNFFGREFTGLWINNNGSVTFNGPREDFSPDVITPISDNPEISPFFTDVDTRGNVNSFPASGNSTGSNLVYYDFDGANDRFIVTWDDVGYFGVHTDKLNAFQLILTDQGNGDFDIEFRYEDVNWTAGDSSGGAGGLGRFDSLVARAGFTAGTGDFAAFFELPTSGNEAAMLNLDETTGNTGEVGRWLFNIRPVDIAPLSVNVGGDISLDEGNIFTRTITFTDGEDADGDGWTYSVDYGDGSTVETGSIAAGSNSFDISHLYTDGDANHNVSVTVTDTGNAADSDTQGFVLSVNNVAPTIAVSGALEVDVGATYTFNLGAVTDPGDDTVTSYIVNWGDSSSDTFNTAGDVTHVYNTIGNTTISVDLVDEDGAYVEAAKFDLTIEEGVVGGPEKFVFDITVPETLAPGTAGPAQIDYESGTPVGSPLTINAALFFVTGEAALVQDPLTLSFDDQAFLLSYGDGVDDIAVGETGASAFEVKGTGGPRVNYTVSASIIDFDAEIDWTASIDLLRPAGITDAAWVELSALLIDRLGTTGADFANALAEYGQKLQTFGLNGESASAALAFLTEGVGDFGSIAGRAAPGSMGTGWTTLADIGLSFDGDTVVLEGLPDILLLRNLNPETSAFYTISESASRAATLAGNVISDVPIGGIQFIETEVGTYASTSLTDVELIKTANGYVVEYADGARLLFDAAGKLLKLVEPDGQETTASRDGNGAVEGFTGPQGAALLFTRNTDGNIEAVTDENGLSINFVYDTDGQLISATSGAGTAQFGYDVSDNLISAKPSGIDVTQIAYDAELRLSSVDYANGLQTETFNYDDVGGITVTDGEGRTTTVDYLPGGAVGRVADGEGNVSALIFNADGELIGIRAPDGTETTFTFDDLGRITSLTDANGATVSFGYVGDAEAPATFTDASGSTRSFTYDDGGRITDAQWADGTSLEFGYDANGNLVMSENRRGEAIDYTYDSNGQLIAQSDGSSGEVSYSYDGQGRLTSAADDRGTTSFEYDSADRITKITYPEGRSLAYTYNDAGLRTSMIDQSGDALFYDFDGLGRLIGLDDINGSIVDYAYDTVGNLIREENGNGTVSTFTYDGANRLTEIVNAQADGTVNSFYRYTYDTAGQRVEMESHDGTWTYGYDAIGQLTSAEFDSINPLIDKKSLVYEYDAAGNRKRVVEDGVETLYTANALNQYTQVGDVTFTYDDDGNMVSKTDLSGTTTYTYDLNGRLVSILEADGTEHVHEYDVLGNRVVTAIDGEQKEYLVDPYGLANVVGEYKVDGSRSSEFIHGIGLVATEANGVSAYYDTDGIGAIGTLSGPDGLILNSYTYDPFGSYVNLMESFENEYTFSGLFGVSQDRDGSYNFRARNYDAEYGRFLAEDPQWAFGDTDSLYRYAQNDPVNLVDPDGELVWIPVGILAIKYGVGTYLTLTGIANAIRSGKKAVDAYNNGDIVGALENSVEGILEVAPGPSIGPVLKAARPGRSIFDFTEAENDVAAMIFDEGFKKVIKKAAESASNAENGELLEKVPTSDDSSGVPREDQSKDNTGENDNADSSAGRGDPWIASFDGSGTSFNAVGEFVYARSEDGTFEVQARQLPFPETGSRISNIYAAATRVGDNKIEIQWVDTLQSLVLVNGTEIIVDVGESIAVGDGSIYRSSNTGYVVSNGHGDGMWVSIGSAFMNVYPFVDPSRTGTLQGVHGNYDGDRTNDFTLPDGTDLTGGTGRISFQDLYTTFADAWRVTDETSLFTYLTGQGTADFTNLNFPHGLVRLEDLDPAAVAEAKAIAIAAGLEPGTWLFETTVFDIAFTGDPSYAETSAEAPDFAFTTSTGETTEIVTAVIDAPPILGEITATADEDGTVTIDVLAQASDPEGNPLTLLSGSDPNGGTVTVENGKLVFVPAANFAGDTVLTYIVRDAAGNEVEGTVPVSVASIPDAPVAVDDSYTMTAGTVLNIAANAGLLANDFDVDGDQLEITAFDPAMNGTLLIATDGSFSYTPNAGFDGQETIDYTISDGRATATATLDIAVEAQVSGVSVNAGTDAVINEGGTFNRTISFTDGEDTNADGWTFSVDWGDGSGIDNGVIAAGTNSFDISRAFTDGDASHTVDVTVTDDLGDSGTQQFVLDVNNVAPIIDLLGNNSVDEGDNYTLSLANLVDPGDDTVISYIVNWGDGTAATTLTAAELLAAGNNVNHVFADGNSSPQITVDLVDEDGTHVSAGSKIINVNNVAPTIALIGNASVDEGSIYTLTGNIFDPGTDTITDFIITWGDGTTTALTAAELHALSGNVTHVYTDGASYPQISVDLVDEDGTHIAAGTLNVTVNNIAPTIALAGAPETNTGDSYTLNLGTITDPGDDTVTSYIVNWGDGSSDAFNAAGNVTHVYATAGNNTISVDLIDEDGTHVNAGIINVDVNAPAEIIHIGDAPLRVSRSDPNAWENAWTNEQVGISHKTNYLDTSESWSSATLDGRNSSVLEGGDIFGGDLGVSGQSLISSTIRQEIDGTEALRFDLSQTATGVTVDVARLEGDVASGLFEGGRLQLFDDAGLVVDELVFSAASDINEQLVTLSHDAGFSSVVLTAGVYNGADFVFGGLADSSGLYQSDPQNLGDGTWNGSDYLVNAIEFDVQIVGAPL